MKKFIKLFFVVAMAFTLTACGGSSTDEQEKAVNSFFTDMKAANLEKMAGYMTEDGYKDVEELQTSVDSNFSEMLNAETYGDTTAKEAQKFLNHVFERLFKSTKISDVKVDGDKTTIKVKGKRILVDNLNDVADSEAVKNLMTEFQENEDNKNKAMEIYLSEGEAGMMKFVMGEIAPKVFAEYSKALDGCDYEDYNAKFTLVKEDGKWLIDSIE